MISVSSMIALLLCGTPCGFLYVNGLSHGYLLFILFLILSSGSIFSHSIMMRIWLLYFTVRVNKATLNDQWQSIINPNKNIQENPCAMDNPNAFYLQNRATYGNFQFLKKKLRKAILCDMAGMFIFFTILAILFRTGVDKQIIHILFAIFMGFSFLFTFIVPLLGIVYFYRLIPDFYDELGLQQELVFLSRMYMLSLVVMLIMLTGFAIDQFVIMDRENGNFGLFYFAITWQIIAFVVFFAAMSMIRRFPNRLAKMYNQTHISVGSVSPTSVAMSTSIKIADAYKEVPNEKLKQAKPIKIKDVLGNEECFEVFIEHLGREYCMESLLSIVEFTQYREYLLSNEKGLKQIYEGQKHSYMFSDSSVSRFANAAAHDKGCPACVVAMAAGSSRSRTSPGPRMAASGRLDVTPLPMQIKSARTP